MGVQYDDDEMDEMLDRLSAYREAVERAIYDLADKHGIDIIYYKNEDREPPCDIEGRPCDDLTHTFQVCVAEPRKEPAS